MLIMGLVVVCAVPGSYVLLRVYYSCLSLSADASPYRSTSLLIGIQFLKKTEYLQALSINPSHITYIRRCSLLLASTYSHIQ